MAVTEANRRAVQFEPSGAAVAKRLVDHADGARIRGPLIDDGVEDRSQGVTHGPNAIQIELRPGTRVVVMNHALLDEPRPGVGGLVEMVDQRPGFEFDRVQELDGGIQGEIVFVVGDAPLVFGPCTLRPCLKCVDAG